MIEQAIIKETELSSIRFRIKSKVKVEVSASEMNTLLSILNIALLKLYEEFEEGSYALDSIYSDILHLQDICAVVSDKVIKGKGGKMTIKTPVAISMLQSFSMIEIPENIFYGNFLKGRVMREISQGLQI